ncbi:DUF4192 domain-containing protein [Nocardia sp. NPDC020380]|uniref:DUF4192 domain-containing protein n=1 Tax=Nocardia sp. NPDC020380 TaxID=3364309 RepID=UPI003789FF18
MSSEAVLKEPDQFIAAVPAMLGFTPERSLVVAMLRKAPDQTHDVHVVVRLDLPPAGQYSEVLQHITRICRTSDAVAALVVIVDDHRSRSRSGHPVGSAGHRRLVEVLRQGLAESDVALTGAWAVRAIEKDAEWWNVESPECRGLLLDPSASLVAARHVFDGRVLRSSRSELVDSIAVDEAMREEVTAHLPVAATDAARRLTRALQIDNPDAYLRMTVWQVMSVITQVRDGAKISASTTAEVAVALRDKCVRDIMLGVAGGAYAEAAERLWTVLTRALPAPDRAEAATLLAFNAYLRGDGPLAGIAIDQALASDPEHRMAYLLDFGFRSAMVPARLKKLVDSGIAAAAGLRVDIGATTTDSGVTVTR